MDDESLVSTKAEPGPFDGFEKAMDDEPLFTLLGRDEDAPGAVLAWVTARRARAAVMPPRPEREAELRQCTAAERIAWAMIEFRKGWREPVEAHRAYYVSDGPPDIAAKAEIDRVDAIKRAHSSLHNALAEANDQADILAKLDACPLAIRQIRGAVQLLRDAADAIKPKRPTYRKES